MSAPSQFTGEREVNPVLLPVFHFLKVIAINLVATRQTRIDFNRGVKDRKLAEFVRIRGLALKSICKVADL